MDSLSSEIWDEWISSHIPDRISADSEIAGTFSCMRRKITKADRVILSSRRLWIFHRMRRLWKKTSWGGYFDLGKMLHVPERHRGTVQLEMPIDLFRTIQSKELSGSFIRWAWVRGIFGAVGSVFFPKRGYYFLFRVPYDEILTGLKDHLQKNDLSVSYRRGSGCVEAMVRGQNDIVDLMIGMGLPNAALKMEEKAIVRSMRDRANRLVNCDASNIRKTVDAARRQIALATFLKKNGHEDELPPDLAELIDLRIANPSASLNELGSAMNSPVSKSTVTYRWKKILSIAETYGFSYDD